MFSKITDMLSVDAIMEGFWSTIGNSISDISYWGCMTLGMIGMLLYIFGYEKGKKYPSISVGIYFIIMIFKEVLLNA